MTFFLKRLFMGKMLCRADSVTGLRKAIYPHMLIIMGFKGTHCARSIVNGSFGPINQVSRLRYTGLHSQARVGCRCLYGR
jgi:hypothetical protein